MRSVLTALVLLTGCSDPTGDAVPSFDLDGGFWDAPWPSDLRRTADGTPDISGFPNPDDVPLLDLYFEAAKNETGFGTNSPAYFTFDRPLDTALLPTPAESLELGSPVFLVDIDPHSPHWGERVPVGWDWQEDRTAFQAANQLTVGPVLGFPLRPDTTYAVVITTDLAAPSPAFHTAWERDEATALHLEPLFDRLPHEGLDPEDVAIATVFTTTDPTAELVAINRYLRYRTSPPALTQDLDAVEDLYHYAVYEGRYSTPVFMEGEPPYDSEGGGFVFDASGRPVVQGWDPMRFSVSVPLRWEGDHGDAGWPVVVYAHGTGGDYRTFCDEQDKFEPATRFAKEGLVGIGVDLPLHGLRAPDGYSAESELTHPFNIFNPDSARGVLRQGAIDLVQIARGLREAPVFTLPDGSEVAIDPDRIMIMGHSQGGLNAALALPFFGEDVQATVVSGAGGGITITLVDRTDPYPIADLIETVLGFDEDEQLDDLHPVSGLIQWLVEPTDPLNYGPYYFQEGALWAGQRPQNVLLTSGLEDVMSPYRIAEALAAAAHTPVLEPAVTDPVSWELAELSYDSGPVSRNAPSFDGGEVTAGLAQFDRTGHFAVFQVSAAADLYQHFLGTAAEGEAVLDLEE